MSAIEQAFLLILNKHLLENNIITEDEFSKICKEIQSSSVDIDKKKTVLV